MEPALPDIFFYCSLAWSCPQVFNSGLGMRLCEGRFHKEFFFFAGFLEFQSYSRHRNHFDIGSKQTHSEKNSSDSYGEVIRSDENFLFCFWWKIWSDIWLVEMVQDLIWEFQRTSLESIHFICMNNDFVSHEKALSTDPDCLPLIRMGLIRHVM